MGWVKGQVRDVKRWTERLFSLQVDADIEPFKAGQYNRLRLFMGEEWVARPYSYVNPPMSARWSFIWSRYRKVR
jgi:ferredoxin/flavodoxin---NADP+ reductase